MRVVCFSLLLVRMVAGWKPTPACQARIDAFCAQSCWPAIKSACQAEGEADLARESGPDPVEWRCYSPGALNSDNETYKGGSCYCSRDTEILAELAACGDPEPTPSPIPPPPLPSPNPNPITDVFVQAQNQYRIPALVYTGAGTLLAFAEVRTDPSTDCGYKWLQVRRSVDSGKTWGPTIDVAGAKDPNFATGNPQVVYHAPTKKVVMVYGAKDLRLGGGCSPGSGVFVVDDGGSDGVTWGTPRNISGDLGGLKAWGAVAPGPGAGGVTTVLNPGRILMSGSYGAYQRDVVFYSDDAGLSWTPSTTPLPSMDESGPIELPSGDIYVTMRNAHATACDCQAYALSKDGGVTFTPVSYDPTLISPMCQASVGVFQGALYFANPADTRVRGDITVRRGVKGGGPTEWASSLLIARGLTWGGYSSMAGPIGGANGSMAAIIFERNTTAGDVISFSLFPLQF